MLIALLLFVAAVVFLYSMKDEVLWEDDKPLKKIDDDHLSSKEKEFYRQVLIQKTKENENNRSASKNERKKRRS